MLFLSLFLAACQTAPFKGSGTGTPAVRTPVSVPTAVSTATWIVTDRTTRRIIYQCYEQSGFGGYISLCDMNDKFQDRRFLAHHLISNVLPSKDGRWLFFGLWDSTTDALGYLYRLRVSNSGIHCLFQGRRFAGYRLEKVEGNQVYFQGWTGGSLSDPNSFLHYHILIAEDPSQVF